MRVAITGSHGFIGRHVAAYFRQEGHHITGLDLHPTEVPYFDRVIRGSILSERHLEEALEGVDTVIHTAAIVEEGGDVERFNKLNVDGARLVAEVAKADGAMMARNPAGECASSWLESGLIGWVILLCRDKKVDGFVLQPFMPWDQVVREWDFVLSRVLQVGVWLGTLKLTEL